MADDLIESLLASESVAVALDRVRLSGRDPVEVSTALRELADQMGGTQPATARLALFSPPASRS